MTEPNTVTTMLPASPKCRRITGANKQAGACPPPNSGKLATDSFEYSSNFPQSSVLFLDILRRSGNPEERRARARFGPDL